MIDANYRKYESYDKFIEEFLFTVMDNGHAIIVVNYKDYQGMIENLNGKVLNSKSLATDIETAEYFDDDIKTAIDHDGNMMITVYNNNSIIVGEPVIYSDKANSFIDSAYFIEEDAIEKAMGYAIPKKNIVPFKIEKKTITV